MRLVEPGGRVWDEQVRRARTGGTAVLNAPAHLERSPRRHTWIGWRHCPKGKAHAMARAQGSGGALRAAVRGNTHVVTSLESSAGKLQLESRTKSLAAGEPNSARHCLERLPRSVHARPAEPHVTGHSPRARRARRSVVLSAGAARGGAGTTTNTANSADVCVGVTSTGATGRAMEEAVIGRVTGLPS